MVTKSESNMFLTALLGSYQRYYFQVFDSVPIIAWETKQLGFESKQLRLLKLVIGFRHYNI